MSTEVILDVWRWTVETEDKNTRLDRFLRAQDPGPTRSQLKRLIEDGFALVDGATSRPAKKLKPGQVVELRVPPPAPLSAEPEDIPLNIIYEDDTLVVVLKPQGLVVHPAVGHPSGTLVNGLLHACSTAGGDPLRPGIVHRLDKDTSGLMVVAKTDAAHAHLAEQFHERTVDRRYMALVVGSPPNRGEWDTLHGRKDGDRKLFSTKVTRGKRARSLFQVSKRYLGATLLQVKLLTGRTHQVRVHCSDHGFPILGDQWYGPRKLPEHLKKIHTLLPGQALHAELLGFDHPTSKERLSFQANAPRIFLDALQSLAELGTVLE